MQTIQIPDIRYYILGVLIQKEQEAAFPLPPLASWTEEFCGVLNKIPFTINFHFELTDLFELEECDDSNVKAVFSSFKHITPVEHVYIYESLPVKYVHFTDTVILKSCNLEVAKVCSESIRKGVSFLKQFNEIKMEILQKTEPLNSRERIKKYCENIEKICALGAHFSPNKERRLLGEDHDVLNELLQNVNDRIKTVSDTTCLNIKLETNKLILIYNENGFSAKDFLAIATSGNSGNIDDTDRGNDNLEATGHKGTGFKSVYNVFEKVEISSGYVKCILDDTEYTTCIFSNSTDDFDVKRKPLDGKTKIHFPVPRFEFLIENQNETQLEFTFKPDKMMNFIKTNGLDSQESFIENAKFLFLDNINQFRINGKIFDKEAYLEENFHKESHRLQFTDEDLQKNMRLKDKEIPEMKQMVTFLFPKNKDSMKSQTNLYCTLPLKNLKFPECNFYVNMPLLELEDGRNTIQDIDGNLWNKSLGHKIFSESNSAIVRAFESFAEKLKNNLIPDRSLQDLLDYFPFGKINAWGNLKDVAFIPIFHKSEQMIHLKTISDLESNYFLLEDHLNKWIQINIDEAMVWEFPFQKYVYYESLSDINKLKTNLQLSNVQLKLLEDTNWRFTVNYFDEIYYEKNLISSRNEKAIEFLKIDLLKAYSLNYDLLYKWYLGKEKCEQAVYSILILDDVNIKGFRSFNEYVDEVQEFFGNKPVATKELKQCFLNLREYLYLNADTTIVNEDDPFLSAVLSSIEQEDLKNFWYELEGVSTDGNNLGQIKRLFINQQVVCKFGEKHESNRYNEYNFLPKKIDSLYTSSVITDAHYIVCDPTWISNIELLSNLDELVKKPNFYDSEQPLVLEIAEKYLNSTVHKEDVKEAIKIYIERTDKITENTVALFEILCKDSTNPVVFSWDMKYISLLSCYKNYIICTDKNGIVLKTSVKFSFEHVNLEPIPQHLKEKFDDKVSEELQNTIFILENSEEELKKQKLKEWLNFVYIINSNNKGKEYCIDFENNLFVVFNEEAFGKMLKDLFKSDYQAPKELQPMNCKLPNPLIKPKFNNLQRIKDIEIDFSGFKSRTTDEQISLLINRFEWKIGEEWHCYAGYGGDSTQSKKCPICKGILYAEASSLKIRNVQVVKGIHVPLLLCGNCHHALKFTEHYFLCLDENVEEIMKDDKESIEQLKDKLNSPEPITICFDMYGNEKKSQSIEMTFAHRKIILYLLNNTDN